MEQITEMNERESRDMQRLPAQTGLRRQLKRVGKLSLFILYVLALLLGVLPIWAERLFGGVALDNILYHMGVELEGTPFSTYASFAFFCILIPLAIALLTLYLKQLLSRAGLRVRIARIARAVLIGVLVVASLANLELRVGFVRYVIARNQTSQFIEEHYVDTASTTLRFPAQKRNLIYIWAESMEASFADVETGGMMPRNVIRPLTELCREHAYFSINAGQGGFLPVTTANFTIGGMTTQSSGLPFITPFHAQNDTPAGPYMPGMMNLGDVLAREGYRNVFLSGSNADFGRQQELFIQHGNYEIQDLKWFYREGIVPRDYFVWWGVEDAKVIETAKVQLGWLASSGQPFNLQLELMDTHAQEGYFSEASSRDFEDQYSNVVAGSAQQIRDFVDWALAQPWGPQTTIVIVGDHLTMQSHYPPVIPEGRERGIYNCFIQSATPLRPERQHGRRATSLDIFPTTLAALGVEIEGDRLSLGTNLFSDQPTLAERVKLEAINVAFNMRSPFYETRILDSAWLEPKPLPSGD